VRFQKVGHALVGVNLIFNASEAVAFVFIDLVFDHAAALADRVHHLLRFLLGATGIVACRGCLILARSARKGGIPRRKPIS
jgi:hypothetical protein